MLSRLNWPQKYQCFPRLLAHTVFPVLVGPHRMIDLVLNILALVAVRGGFDAPPQRYPLVHLSYPQGFRQNAYLRPERVELMFPFDHASKVSRSSSTPSEKLNVGDPYSGSSGRYAQSA